jgi:hypothetical protein
MTVPNTANPVDGGNINNVEGSHNRWSYAMNDLCHYDTIVGGGAGPDWHRTEATRAHEQYHFYTDWIETSVYQQANWPQAEVDIEGCHVSVFQYLTYEEADAALAASVDAAYNSFMDVALAHYYNVIVPADLPGNGSGGYAAGQAVLNADISAIDSYRSSKGW